LETVPETASAWVGHLTRHINRLGFKEYFKPIQRIGKGGCGVVYEVESLVDGRRFAAKAFSKDNLHKERRTMKGLVNEVKIMRRLDHRNVMKLYGVYESANSIYFLLELLKGGNLLEGLEKVLLLLLRKTVAR
jgi:calcium-dependent protein kinase